MSICSEFAIIKVAKENTQRVIELSLYQFNEMK
jgi:hypothetical protein